MIAMKDISEKEVLGLIAEGLTQSKIAAHFGYSRGAYINWTVAEQDRPARLRAAMMLAARSYADSALDELDDAKDMFGLAKAREKASHYRWLSSKYDRALYGEKLDVQTDHSITVLVTRNNGDIVDVTPKNISKDEYKQLEREGGVLAAGVGVALGNPTSTATHAHNDSHTQDQVPRETSKEEPKPKKKSILHSVGGIIRSEMENGKDTK